MGCPAELAPAASAASSITATCARGNDPGRVHIGHVAVEIDDDDGFGARRDRPPAAAVMHQRGVEIGEHRRRTDILIGADEAIQVTSGTITSSPGPISRASKADAAPRCMMAAPRRGGGRWQPQRPAPTPSGTWRRSATPAVGDRLGDVVDFFFGDPDATAIGIRAGIRCPTAAMRRSLLVGFSWRLQPTGPTSHCPIRRNGGTWSSKAALDHSPSPAARVPQ